MKKIEDETQFEQVIQGEQPVVVVFKTTWCPDCHYIDPFMDDVIRKYEGQLEFLHVDRDELPDVCERHNILGIPSFVVFKQGQELVRFVSKLRKTREEIEQFLDRAVQVAAAMA